MRWPSKVDESGLLSLRVLAPMVGATNAYPGDFPSAMLGSGVNPREPYRNTYLGLTTTRPEPDLLVFGLAYRDWKDGRHDEDVYSLDLGNGMLDRHGARAWEAARPEYKGTHHGDKSYLL